MSTPFEDGPVAGEPANFTPVSPPNMRTAVMDLIASRVDIARIESKELALQGIKSLVLVIAAGCAAFFSWALILAGLVHWIAQAAGWAWHWVALAAGLLHLLAAALMVKLAKPTMKSAFPITRSEFHKDREWIENFHHQKKPNG